MGTDDYVEIQQLLARYCHVVDNKQWDQLASIFTPDAGVTVVGIYPRTTGIEAIIPLYSTVMRHPLAHESTSLIVTEESETVTRIASKWVTVRANGNAGAGVYEDEVVRTSEGWRIKERVARPVAAPDTILL
ncbi:MAG TPA: nuclear transport factor 2 family protein [Acidimicrobiales bacterium]|jgi:ketosteroid isomerase-like protein